MRINAPNLTSSCNRIFIETFICLKINALLLITSIYLKSIKIYYSKSVAAWPSSVRALKRMVNSQNGRNPYCLFIVFSIYRWTIITGYDAKSVMKWGWRQVCISLTNWATHVLQWPLQWEAITWVKAKP